MGQLDGSSRPGQLGDTGIIVLTKCATYENGCECGKALLAEKTSTTTTTTTTEAYNNYNSFRSSGFRTRNHNRVPRKQDRALYQESATTPRTYSNRLSGRFSSYRSRNSKKTAENPAPTFRTKTSYSTSSSSSSSSSRFSSREKKAETSAEATTRRNFFRKGRGSSRFSLAKRL